MFNTINVCNYGYSDASSSAIIIHNKRTRFEEGNNEFGFEHFGDWNFI